jgi:hypothetical protein
MEAEANPVFTEDYLEKALAVLGYPGFAHLARFVQFDSEHEYALDLAALLRWAVIQDVLDVRLIEGLPWLIAAYAVRIDWNRLTCNVELIWHCNLRSLSNLFPNLKLVEY